MSANTTHNAQPAEGLTFYMREEHHPEQSTMIGFWIYLMSDCLIFAILFATYAVLGHSFAGGPDAKELFDLKLVAINTAMLLFSSITYGFAMLEMEKGNKGLMISWMMVTFFFGACFLGIELYEFHHLIGEGAGPGRSAFLSAFFTLVGTHGIHVTCGLVWMAVLMVQMNKFGITAANKRRMTTLSMFWHFLDVIWIGVFSFVYLMGVL
ncbi:cytochrome o ubiquinol oxidase subunit III [Rhizobium sp. C4]|uniref:cytochrome o ubiquinol oxidase subunit III n=1 Tax=Rhizobium sp. C4 TaxID=1349800 RepID=UPI001E3CC519|nr:cytochrome o ubiquinol oxidase subunit III [Rhizobium sp. C4]MCD2173863.1 cytochrome o ubiquinol oxidase subunit III [Rhizobium sp. C4]